MATTPQPPQLAQQASVPVSFVTSLEHLRVTNAPIAVPVQLRRFGLSEIVNHLLGRADKPVPFDFLVNGEVLRTTLAKFIEQHQLSTEAVLTLEYIQSLPPPKPKPDLPHDDWVSAVHANESLVLSGSYDGNVRVWDYASSCHAVLQGHIRPVRAVRWLSAQQGYCLSAGDDSSVKLWRFNLTGTDATPNRVACEFVGHASAVHALAPSPKGDRFVSAGWDSTIRMWPAVPDIAASDDATAITTNIRGKGPGTKRSRLSEPKRVAPSQHSLAVFEGHNGAVEALCWPDDTRVFSGGWDHTIRMWDATSGLVQTNMSTGRVITSLSYSHATQLLASAHEDRTVRLWDPRMQDGTVVKLRLTSHLSWVSSVAWAPDSSHYLVSGSYDHSLKLWDIRAASPVHTIAAHTSKVLCVDWSHTALVSGGADNQLRLLEPPVQPMIMQRD